MTFMCQGCWIPGISLVEQYLCEKTIIENSENIKAEKEKVKDKDKKYDSKKEEVVCSYGITRVKIYLVLMVWLKYLFDCYIIYWKQFKYLSTVKGVPEELKPFYSEASFEEAKVHCMFNILMKLEKKYHNAVHLTIVYMLNLYCTLWWMTTRLSSNGINRTIIFQVLQKTLKYSTGDAIRSASSICSSHTVTEGACQICFWVKEFFCKALVTLATFTFLEELLLGVLLTLMSTPVCVALFLAYRLYKGVLLPHFIEESTSNYTPLEDGPLLNTLLQLCQKLNSPVEKIYVSNNSDKWHGAAVRGVGDRKHLVLSKHLTEGHISSSECDNGLCFKRYTVGEVAAAVARAQADYNLATPHLDLALESTRWISTTVFAVFVCFGFFGGSRLGFVPSPPQSIAYLMTKHLAIPIFIFVQLFRNFLTRKRQFYLDEKVADVGFGDEMINQIGKEARNNFRCPIEDPFFTMVYANHPSTLDRIQNLRVKLNK